MMQIRKRGKGGALMFESIFTRMQVSAAVVDSAGSVTFRNNQWRETFGEEENPVHTSASIGEFFRTHCLSGTLCSEKLFSLERKDHRIGWYYVECLTLNENASRSYGFLFHDKTESVEAQMVMEAYFTVGSEVFLFLDSKERVLECSKQAAKVFGFLGREEALGMHYTTFLNGKLSKTVINQVFEQLHIVGRYKKMVELPYLGRVSYYELQAYKVMLKGRNQGAILLFKEEKRQLPLLSMLGEEVQYEEENEKREEVVVKGLEEAAIYKKELVKLKNALEQFEYMEINELLERIYMIAPREDYLILEQIQEEVMEFHYEKAIKCFGKGFASGER